MKGCKNKLKKDDLTCYTIVSNPTIGFELGLDKMTEITYFLRRKTALLHILSIYGGETASTGIKKLKLHTERPVSS